MRHRKILITVLIFVMLGAATIWTISSSAQQLTGTVSNIDGGLRLREVPVDGTILTLLNPGTPVTIIGQTTDASWLQIRTNEGQTGWVAAQFIERDVQSAPPVVEAQPQAPAPEPVVGEPVTDPNQFDAEVLWSVGMLNVRSAPGTDTDVVAQIPGGTPLVIVGRTGDNAWLKIRTPEGLEGWVVVSYVQINTELEAVADAAAPIVPIDFSGIVSNITPRASEIYRYGQSLGNRPDVFSKIGDSITVSNYMLYPIGWGRYNLGGYSHLQPVIDYYRATVARDANSFSNNSLSAVSGWSTENALQPRFATPGTCLEGETPLVCEYRVVRPSIAFIMYGTNDSGYMEMHVYQNNLRAIVQLSIDNGVIPVLSTVPNRAPVQDRINEMNRLIWQISREYSIPLIDYWGAMQRLPNTGLAGDGVHPSEPPGGYVGAANFTDENLQYGYTVRNITTLYALDAIWRQIILPG